MQDIDIYYESIRQVYEQIKNRPKPKIPRRKKILDVLMGFAITVFVLSLIPIIPSAIILIGGWLNLTIRQVALKGAGIGTFFLAWGVLFVAALALLLIIMRLDSKSSHDQDEKPPDSSIQTLSPEQIAFVEIYEAYKELKIFLVSHVEQHVGNSLKAIRRAIGSRYTRSIILSEYDQDDQSIEDAIMQQRVDASVAHKMRQAHSLLTDRHALKPSFPQQLAIARSFLHTFEKYAWFQMDAETKSYLQAIISFSEKIPPRLEHGTPYVIFEVIAALKVSSSLSVHR